MSAFEKLLEPFPQSAIEKKQGMAYIAHDTIRMRVIEATDNAFDWVVTGMEYRNDGVVKERQNRSTGEMFTPQVMIVTGNLSIPGLGTRTGIGVQTLEAGSGEDMYKGAESDAFKRAAMSFGVALKQLYTDDGKPQQAQQQPAPPPAPKPLHLDQADIDRFMGRIFDANNAEPDDRRKATNALYKEAQQSPELADLLIANLSDYNAARMVADELKKKGLLTAKGEQIINGRAEEVSQ